MIIKEMTDSILPGMIELVWYLGLLITLVGLVIVVYKIIKKQEWKVFLLKRVGVGALIMVLAALCGWMMSDNIDFISSTPERLPRFLFYIFVGYVIRKIIEKDSGTRRN